MNYPTATRKLWVKEVYENIKKIPVLSNLKKELKLDIKCKKDIGKFNIEYSQVKQLDKTISCYKFTYSTFSYGGSNELVKTVYIHTSQCETKIINFIDWLSLNDALDYSNLKNLLKRVMNSKTVTINQYV